MGDHLSRLRIGHSRWRLQRKLVRDLAKVVGDRVEMVRDLALAIGDRTGEETASETRRRTFFEKMVRNLTVPIADPTDLVCDPMDSVEDRIEWVGRSQPNGAATGHAGTRKRGKMVPIPHA